MALTPSFIPLFGPMALAPSVGVLLTEEILQVQSHGPVCTANVVVRHASIFNVNCPAAPVPPCINVVVVSASLNLRNFCSETGAPSGVVSCAGLSQH